MKILCAEYNERGEVGIVPMGDDVLLRNNGDFYMPDFTEEVSVTPQPVVRICKLGKGVNERFAGRYFDAIGLGIRFYADTLEKELESKGLPSVIAASFDCSAAISALLPWEEIQEFRYEMSVNGEIVCRSDLKQLPLSIERLIAIASNFHTLKIGDYLYCGHPLRHRGLKVNDRIRLNLNGKNLLDFKIK